MQNKIQGYKDLFVWQKAMELVTSIYEVTALFPDSEKFGLISQMRRCAVSIPSNIAEGRYRGTKKDFRQFLIISFGSGAELETQILIAKRLTLSSKFNFERADSLLDEVMKMLNSMISSLKANT
jgi:four helix bundle protein